MKRFFLLVGLLYAGVTGAYAELKVPAVFTSHMVLQQKMVNPVWGWDTPGTKVTVTFAGQTKEATAGEDGKWMVKLDPLPANAQPQALAIAGTEQKQIEDVLVGEVWMCSGQSNMVFLLRNERTGDLQTAAAKNPKLRLLRVPNVASQEPKTDFKGEWEVCSPESAGNFSAVGYFFGRYLQEILDVPVGLIANAWGGSAAEAWIRRTTLEQEPQFKALLAADQQKVADIENGKGKEEYAAAVERFKALQARVKSPKKLRPPQPPEAWLTSQQRPANIFGGVLNPTLGYGIKGVIWYQGESNTTRAWEYAQLFPFMIEQWRKEQGQGDFPFYWVQLADFKAETPQPSEGEYAELREAQTKAMRLPNTGQAVILDLGEGENIHPRDKYSVASRLVRWALAKDYGMKIPYRSPEFKSMETHEGGRVTVTFDCFGSTLRTFDIGEVRGFAVCGEDKAWHWAKGTLKDDQTVELTCDQVEYPVHVRYAWADNPVCNLYSEEGLPATPFRTDDFDLITKPK